MHLPQCQWELGDPGDASAREAAVTDVTPAQLRAQPAVPAQHHRADEQREMLSAAGDGITLGSSWHSATGVYKQSISCSKLCSGCALTSVCHGTVGITDGAAAWGTTAHRIWGGEKALTWHCPAL